MNDLVFSILLIIIGLFLGMIIVYLLNKLRVINIKNEADKYN